MKELIFLAIFFLPTLLLQTTIIPLFVDSQYKPDLFLILVFWAAIRITFVPAAVFAFAAGLLTGIFSGLFLAWALGIEINFLNMGWIQAVVLLATQLPFAVAGGLGIREVTLVALLGTFGVSADLSLALSFLIFVRSILIGLLGGLIEAIGALRNKRSPTTDPVSDNIEDE